MVMAYDRQELMEAYAEYSLLAAVPPVKPQGVFAGVGATAEQGDTEEEEVQAEPEAEERPDVAEAAEMTELELRRRELLMKEKRCAILCSAVLYSCVVWTECVSCACL